MGVDEPAYHDSIVSSLRDALRDSVGGLKYLPDLLKRVLREEMWRDRLVQRTGERVTFDRFEAFVTTPPLEGLGATVQTLRNLCRDDPEALDLLDRAFAGRQGERTDLVDNVNEVDERPTGNRADVALRRLRKDRPDLHERVIAGEMSPHAAMVAAGFRPKTITVPCSVQGFAQAARRHLSRDDVEALGRLLHEGYGKEATES